jgi:uncharacterized protein (DUF362 family)
VKEVSRREFLKYAGLGALGFVARPRLLPALEGGLFPLGEPSDVVQCFHQDATTGSAVNEPVVQCMVDESIMALAGIRNVGEAWKTIFPGITESSVIGIKVNCASRQCPTRPETVRCIANSLAQMDFDGTLFKKNNIVIWERTNSELTAAGFTKYTGSDPDTVRCYGTNESGVGYDANTTLVVANSSNQNPSMILSKTVDYLINAPVLKTHGTAKLTLALKNHYGSVSNSTGLQHTSSCSPAIPSLNQQIRDVITPTAKQKLFLIDGLFGMYSGGPSGSPNFNPKLLIVSKDPVACDKQGQNVVNAERVLHSLPQLDAPWITAAAEPPYSLGSTEINLIELNNVGVGDAARVLPGQGLFHVAPEPVRGRATVTFTVPRNGPASLELLDAAGRTEARLFAGTVYKGKHRVEWRSGRTPAGTHFLRLNCGGAVRLRKVAVVN